MPTVDGNIVITNAQWCHFNMVLTSGGLFKDTHGIAWYNRNLYAFGSNKRFIRLSLTLEKQLLKHQLLSYIITLLTFLSLSTNHCCHSCET